ncbi:MAG: flagellar transcriptional regulator FlhC [Gammaproteobacteria bacterium]|nr:flagellar transcriptional regulator FlhC [Gammaproteobacteria bacterium]
MRVTDHRYRTEIDRFNLAVRMIGHEARTGTIRACTGFSEDRIRKIYNYYFRTGDGTVVRRRRGKSPTRIRHFVDSTARQLEASLLAGLFVLCAAAQVSAEGRVERPGGADRVALGERVCQAFEAYRNLFPEPRLSFEWAWNLYHALADSHDLYLAQCEICGGRYVQDAYALDYGRCPFCEMKDYRGTAQI